MDFIENAYRELTIILLELPHILKIKINVIYKSLDII